MKLFNTHKVFSQYLYASFENNKIVHCKDYRLARAVKLRDILWYGDAEFDCYRDLVENHLSLDAFVKATPSRSGCPYATGNEADPNEKLKTFAEAVQRFSPNLGTWKNLELLLPDEERPWEKELVEGRTVYDDGNFTKVVCASDKYYYVFNFMTS